MELKRILARDTRSAMEQAISVYGPDVLVISNHQVGGQTELVVALEVPPADHAQPEPAHPSQDLLIHPPAPSFRQSLEAASQPQASAPNTAPLAAATLAQTGSSAQPRPAEPAPAATPAATPALDTGASAAALTPPSASTAQDARDYLRSREIVDLVRDEIAALRREFRMRQQTSAWQSGLNFAPALAPLVQALQDASMPGALRALLLDAVSGCAQPQQAVQALREQLIHHLQRPVADLPLQGLHLLAGPSGAGKTLMTARLAQRAAQSGSEQVALISYQDVRAGAWSQTQMLAAQLGVDAFRANDAQSLRLLVNELSNRQLVLIDTAGVQMSEQVTQILSQAPSCQAHAVLPVDASGAMLERVLGQGLPFQSLLLTKLDEADSAWPLLQFLGDNPLAVSGASSGSRLSDLTPAFPIEQLVDFALAPLTTASLGPAPEALSAAAEGSSQEPGAGAHASLSHTLTAIAQLPAMPAFLSTAQVLGSPQAANAGPAHAVKVPPVKAKAAAPSAQPVQVTQAAKAAKPAKAAKVTKSAKATAAASVETATPVTEPAGQGQASKAPKAAAASASQDPKRATGRKSAPASPQVDAPSPRTRSSRSAAAAAAPV